MKNRILLFAILCTIGFAACAQEFAVCNSLDEAAEFITHGQGNYALKYLDDYLKENPRSADAFFLRTQIKTENEMYEEALDDINKAIEYWKEGDKCKKPILFCWRASLYNHFGEVQSAIENYTAAYNLVAENDTDTIMCSVLYQRAQLYYVTGDLESADADYEKMIDGGEVIMGYIGLACNMYARGEYAYAIALLDGCEKKDSLRAEIYYYRMQSYSKLGAREKAIDDAITYLKVYADFGNEETEKIFRENHPYAIAKVEEVIEAPDITNEEKENWHKLLASLYMGNNEFRAAIHKLKEIKEVYGESQMHHLLCAISYKNIGCYDKAAAELDEFIDKMQGTESSYINDLLLEKAYCYRMAGRYQDAIEIYGTLLGDYFDNTGIYYLRGWCYELMGNDKAAMAEYNKGIETGGDYAYIYLMRGHLHLKQGKKALATADFEQVLRLDTVPEDGCCRFYALHFMGRDDEAIEFLERYIEACGHDSGSYYDKACLLARMGKKEEAVEALSTAFEKGFRGFTHIEYDDDLDAIRKRKEFKKLVKKYKERHEEETKDL